MTSTSALSSFLPTSTSSTICSSLSFSLPLYAFVFNTKVLRSGGSLSAANAAPDAANAAAAAAAAAAAVVGVAAVVAETVAEEVGVALCVCG
jgi:hypothetical protein